MKYKGKAVVGRNEEVIPILRPDGDIIFIAQAIQNWDEFNELVKPPEAPILLKPGGVKVANVKDKAFMKAVGEYEEMRTNYIVLASLQNSPDLEWESVDIRKPSTWANFRKELIAAKFTDIEMSRIIVGVRRANSLDEDMIDEARENFLLGQQGSEN
jgi:hypothetical protein